MEFTTEKIAYRQTGFFSALVTDYLDNDPALDALYAHRPDLEGIQAVMANRAAYKGDRKLLVDQLRKQYQGMPVSEKVRTNIEALLKENVFTVCTAHQPNIFTGHLYFIYKILHAIKLAEELSRDLPGNQFVPVFYLGSEDADLDELGHIYLDGEKYSWETKQTGAVGRMKVDKALTALIDTISGQLTVHPFGAGLVEMLKRSYQEGRSMEQATFHLVHELFAGYGLLVLLPDNPELKSVFIPVAEKELLTSFSHQAVAETIATFPKKYKVQAGGRDINLFYLNDDSRERIVLENSEPARPAGGFKIQNLTVRQAGSKLSFTEATIKEELHNHPERFSPNVILRPVFQEMILPNVAFIGGGGEIAYWLELKKVFEAVSVPFPVLLLRNSFMIVEKKRALLADKLRLPVSDLFKTRHELMNQLAIRDSGLQLELGKEKEELAGYYAKLAEFAAATDPTLGAHVKALETGAAKKINELEKKMLRAAKRKMEAEARQVNKLSNGLFPSGQLQERMDNILPYYSQWGPSFLNLILTHTKGMEPLFTVVTEKP